MALGPGMGTAARQSDPLARIAKMDLPELQSLVGELMQNVEAVRPYLARKFALEDAPAEQIVKDARQAIKDAAQEVYDGWHYRSRGYHGNDYDDDVDDGPGCGLVQDYFARLAKLGKIKELMQLCDYFVKRATEQMNASGDEDDVMFSGIQRVVAVVAHAVFASGLADSEKLLWEYRRETCDEYGFLESDSDQTLNFWKRKGIKRETWSQVADTLLKDCQVSGERYYEAIVRALTAMKPTLAKLSGEEAWRALVAGLAEKHHRRRNLVMMLEKLL